MKRLEPCWFKKWPAHKASSPNAKYMRPLGEVGTLPVCEIFIGKRRWIVKESEVKSEHEAIQFLLKKWTQEIWPDSNSREFKKPNTKKSVYEKLKISAPTLNSRLAFISHYENIQ